MFDIPIKDVIRRTGKSYHQLTDMRKRGQGRWARCGKLWCLHPDDADKLEHAKYQGAAL